MFNMLMTVIVKINSLIHFEICYFTKRITVQTIKYKHNRISIVNPSDVIDDILHIWDFSLAVTFSIL